MANRTIQQSILTLVILAASSGVLSKEISYNFIQASYVGSSVDINLENDLEADGVQIEGSFGITPNIALTASYRYVNFDSFQGVDISATNFKLGITPHTSIGSETSLFGTFSALIWDVDADVSAINDNDVGFAVDFGFRHMVVEVVEVEVIFLHEDAFEVVNNSLGFGARFYSSDKISLGISYSIGSDIEILLLNARIDI
jgi:hypothetical protein